MSVELVLTYKDLLDRVEVLKKVFSSDVINIRLALRLKKLLDFVEKELNYFDQMRLSLIRKYGERVFEDGKELERVKAENMDKFSSELNELLSTKITYQFEKITISELEHMKLSAIDLKMLEPFIVFEE
jgi:hypothetical protein